MSPIAARAWGEAKASRLGFSEPDPTDPTGFATRVTVPIYVYFVLATSPEKTRNGWRTKKATVLDIVE